MISNWSPTKVNGGQWREQRGGEGREKNGGQETEYKERAEREETVGGHPKRRKEARKKGQNRYFNILRTRDRQIKVTMRCYHQSAKIGKK